MTQLPAALARPSTWFVWHARYIRPGSTVLDLACGTGRHAIAAARLGARVTAVDHDPAALGAARDAARAAGVTIDFQQADLTAPWQPGTAYETVLAFNYLDRARMPDVRAHVAPGGLLVMETYLAGQRALGWGPMSDEHLLEPGELMALARPLDVLFGREVLEPVGSDRFRLVASVLARRPGA